MEVKERLVDVKLCQAMSSYAKLRQAMSSYILVFGMFEVCQVESSRNSRKFSSSSGPRRICRISSSYLLQLQGETIRNQGTRKHTMRNPPGLPKPCSCSLFRAAWRNGGNAGGASGLDLGSSRVKTSLRAKQQSNVSNC